MLDYKWVLSLLGSKCVTAASNACLRSNPIFLCLSCNIPDKAVRQWILYEVHSIKKELNLSVSQVGIISAVRWDNHDWFASTICGYHLSRGVLSNFHVSIFIICSQWVFVFRIHNVCCFSHCQKPTSRIDKFTHLSRIACTTLSSVSKSLCFNGNLE